MRYDQPHPNETQTSPEDLRARLDAYAWHAAAANGFGDAGLGSLPRADAVAPSTASPAPPLPGVLDAAALFIARTLEAAERGWWAWRSARATDTALSALDDRALRDLGIDRSEISSVATGVGGHGDPTRVRMSQGLQGLLA